MSICPNCNEEIDSLNYSQPCITYGNVSLYHGELNYDNNGRDEDNGNPTFSCPECNKDLFYSCIDAKEFLSEEIDLKPEPFKLFLCEEHNLRFDESCPKCRDKEKVKDNIIPEKVEKVIKMRKGWYI